MKSSTADELAGLEGSSKLWIGKDYVNFIHKDPVDVHNPFEGMRTVNVLKSFCFQIKCWLSRQECIKCLSEKQTGKTLIRVFRQKQSDLGLHCLSRPFFQRLFLQCIQN